MSNRGNRPNNLEIEGAQFYFKNFRGAQTDCQPAGKRTFGVFIDPDMADKLADDGWNVKWTKPKDDRDPVPYLPVDARFDNFPPKIMMLTESGGRTLIDETTVSMLDSAEIVDCDMIISPSFWEVGGKSGIKAYLHTMYVTIQEDRFASKYADL